MKHTQFLIICMILIFPKFILSQELVETYTLDEEASTSAGVYNSEGKLLRTLYSNIIQEAGTYTTPEWNGLDDQGNDVFMEGAYVKVVTNTIQAEWEGVIGNNSQNITGEGIWRGQHFPNEGITIGDRLYIAYGANERDGSIGYMEFSNPGVKHEVFTAPRVYPAYTHLAYDGTTLYFAGTNEWQSVRNLSYVSSATIPNLFEHSNWNSWANGSTTTIFDETYPVADLINDSINKPKITGLAVQQSNQNLFIARGLANSLRVIDKTTGALKQAYTNYINPKLCKIDANNFLWFIHGPTGNEVLEKFTIDNATGNFTTTGITLTGLNNVRCLTLNNDSSEILVGDADTFSQVISYRTADLTQQWVLGRAESYYTDATVYDDKMLFSNYDDLEDRLGFIAYEPDGSLWVNDFGNERFLKFDPSRNYEDQLIWKSNFYQCHVDPGNPTRVFARFQEYSVDYSLPLRESWKLEKNWGNTVVMENEDIEKVGLSTIKHIETLSNGRTYGLVATDSDQSKILQFIEFVEGGTLRGTGVMVPNPDKTVSMRAGGKIDRGKDNSDIGGDWEFYTRDITGFDTNHNPILGDENQIGNITPNTDFPLPDFPRNFSAISENNVLGLFAGARKPISGKYHFAGFELNTNRLKFRTLKGQIFVQNDPYPIGQNIFDEREVFGGPALAMTSMDDFFIWHYYGEGWRQTQTNYWHLIHDSGLFLTDFGTNGTLQSSFFDTYEGMAGNAFSPSIVKVNGQVYLYHNDESWHGGLHRWKINNLSSIREFNMPINSAICQSNCHQEPFILPFNIPGKIEAENYDKGGQGTSYNDSEETNYGGEYRIEGVDIQVTEDVDGGYNVGYIRDGEWLEYTIDVAESGLYDITARVASSNGGGSYRLEVDGEAIVSTTTIGSTGGWQSFIDSNHETVILEAGTHILRFYAVNGGFNLNWINFTYSIAVIPGTIEAENYDKGGQGIAYNDIEETNFGGAYRTDGVDIQVTTDTGGGYNVGYIRPGEWLQYNVTILDSGLYDMSARVASRNGGGSYRIELDGVPIINATAIDSTGGWQSFIDSTHENIILEAGEHILRFYAISGGFNLNWINFSCSTAVIPGKIEAENYDKGGQGIAYNDNEAENLGGAYRTKDGVDIQVTTDTGGGYNIGYFNPGEWLQYTIDVTESDSYTVTTRIASSNGGGSYRIELDGVPIAGATDINSTGGWQSFVAIDHENIMLEAGTYTLRFYAISGGFNLNWISFSSSTGSASKNSPANDLIKLYPNPTADHITIHGASGSRYALFDAAGIVVQSGPIVSDTTIIQFSTMAKGVYFMKVVQPRGTMVKKIVLK